MAEADEKELPPDHEDDDEQLLLILGMAAVFVIGVVTVVDLLDQKLEAPVVALLGGPLTLIFSMLILKKGK